MNITNSLPTDYQNFIVLSRYARWDDEKKRREFWPETVNRYFRFFRDRFEKSGKMTEYLSSSLDECEKAVVNLEVFPSMRAMMTAGKALSRDEVAGFNCCYVSVDHPHVFDEILYILACGAGVGFSVESDDVKKLPSIPDVMHDSDSVIVVPDSKIGWATSPRELISMLYAGKVPKWDLSRIRKKGARLKTFGGRASGPDPLRNVFEFVVRVFKDRAGNKLRPIDCHDIVCKIAECIVVGGVRRSALISLSDLSDNDMRHCKSGNWWENNGQRSLANNSAVYNEKPSIGDFMDEWVSLYRSGSGERGINNRYAAIRYMKNGRRDVNHKFGTNPCYVPDDCPILTKDGYVRYNLTSSSTRWSNTHSVNYVI